MIRVLMWMIVVMNSRNDIVYVGTTATISISEQYKRHRDRNSRNDIVFGTTAKVTAM